MDPNKNLAKALGVDFEEKEKKDIVKKKPTEITVDHKDIQDPDLKKDYLATRKNQWILSTTVKTPFREL